MLTSTQVSYSYLEEYDIHEFIFTESSRQSIEEYIAYIYDMYEEKLKHKPDMLIILDIHQSGMLPVKYATAIMEKMFAELQPFPTTFVAYLTDETSDKSLISTLDYTASRKVNRLHFAAEDREHAIEWLLSRRNSAS